jgi:hypothetical protein
VSNYHEARDITYTELLRSVPVLMWATAVIKNVALYMALYRKYHSHARPFRTTATCRSVSNDCP